MEKKYKDTLFRCCFSERENLLSLLNALLDTNETNPDEITINTLDGLFFDENGKNDVSCTFKDKYLILIEHQSTLNYNMPMRCLFYVTELYKQIIEPYKDNRFNFKNMEMFRPEFLVLYNGTRKAPAIQTLRLSDSFKGSGGVNLELIVNQYNINSGYNEELLSKSSSLKFYCTFVERVKFNKTKGFNLIDAIHEAYDYCWNQSLMRDFLNKYRRELGGMYWFEYDPEAAKKFDIDKFIEEEKAEVRAKAQAEGLAEGRAEGRAEGHAKGLAEGLIEGEAKGETKKMLEMVKNFLAVGTPIEFIIKATGWTEEQILKTSE